MTKNNKYIPSIDILKIGITAIQDMMEKEDRWDKTFQEMYNGTSVPDYFSTPYAAICKMIETTYNDISGPDGSHISWWIWEADCGKNLKLADSVTDVKTGKNIPMRTIEDVYNYYVKYTLGGKQ